MAVPDGGHPVVTVAQMVAAEQKLFDAGISVDALMQRAGQGAAAMIWRIGGDAPTLVLCGPGNNGGDGYVIAEFLRLKGVPVTVCALGEPRTDAARNARAAFAGPVGTFAGATVHPQLVDCLFGSGLARPMDQDVWEKFSSLVRSAQRSFAIDLPSGVDADRAIHLDQPLTFDHVLALGAYKYAHMLEPTATSGKTLSLIDIGAVTDRQSARRLGKPRIAPPDASSHKYRRGLVAIIVGTMSGAAMLAARAAQGTGAGYVKLIGAGPAPAMLPADMVWERADDTQALARCLADERIGSVLVGPGLGRDARADALLTTALACSHPLVIDADAIHLLADHAHAVAQRVAPVLLTPHHGEFTALAQGIGLLLDQANKAFHAGAMATTLAAHILYKGADSVIAAPDGMLTIADRQCSWLSVAGSGDVLAGCIAARLANHGGVQQAMAEGTWLHDRAARIAGPAFTALQLAQALSTALESCLER